MSSTPTDRKYSETNEWFKVDGDVVTMGITRFAADQLTDITFVELPAVGSNVAAGEPCGEIESVKATSDLISWVSGEVIETNAALVDTPELINNDPFEAGWMIKIRTTNLSSLDKLMDAAAHDEVVAGG